MTNDMQVAALLDKHALSDNLVQYCRGIDRMNLDLMKSTYWPDSTDDHGRFVGNGHDWCEEAIRSREVLISCNTHISNIYSEVEGSLARRESMFITVTAYKAHGSLMFLGGRYRDRCEKRDGNWKVLNRVCIWDWNREIAANSGWHLMRAPEISNWGQFFPSDPIYQDWQSSPPTAAADSGRHDVSAMHGSAS